MAPWFTVTPQPAILSELLCILGAEGCAVERIPKARGAIIFKLVY